MPDTQTPLPRPSFVPRPAQTKILAYTGGPMGVSAVPGSGKTFTLSLLAAQLVGKLATSPTFEPREILVVTFTNSAVANFRARIGTFLRQERGLLPGVGYRVRTLHALAHDIVRERPALVGLGEGFEIVDGDTSAEIKREAARDFLARHPDAFAPFIRPELLHTPRQFERHFQEDALELANVAIRVAKELTANPALLQQSLARQSGTFPLVEFALSVYTTYTRSLNTRGAVDFDDLIVLALQALRADEGYLARLQARWPYILEDEAQDSSLLQEKMLRLLTAAHGNWVRVGDPNQAIHTTFTSADARFLQRFLREHPQQARDLPNSGRSALPILELANALIDWSRTEHPILGVDQALAYPRIEPTPPDDPQPNPAAGQPSVHFHEKALTADAERESVVASVRRWVADNPGSTVAVLVPDNQRGDQLVAALKNGGLPFDESLLRNNQTSTRAAAHQLAIAAGYIANPQSANLLQQLWAEVWSPRRTVASPREDAAETDSSPRENKRPAQTFALALGKLKEPERFVFPGPDDFLDRLAWLAEAGEPFRRQIEQFRQDLQRWCRALVLPVDELLLTLGNDLFVDPGDLALTHQLAVLLAKLARENPALRLADLVKELQNIAQNRRRLVSFTEESQGYSPRPGVVTVATMHGAKGLEWDRVYLTSVNTFSFPSGLADEPYRSERWYLREGSNLAAELEEQLRQLHMGTLDDYLPGRASQQARLALAAERLRLLYVGITRARRELIVTYNLGRQPEKALPPARPFLALAEYWQRRSAQNPR